MGNKEAKVGHLNCYGVASVYVVLICDKDDDSLIICSNPFLNKDAAEKAAEHANREIRDGKHPTADLLVLDIGEPIEA
jgi:hypothetical protein